MVANDQVQIMMRVYIKLSPCGSHYEAMDGLYSSKSLFVTPWMLGLIPVI